MRKYEIMFIVKSDTTEEERKEKVSNLENAFTKNKATITLSKESVNLVFTIYITLNLMMTQQLKNLRDLLKLKKMLLEI